MSVMPQLSRQGRSPVTTVLVGFLSLVVLGLLLRHFTDTLIRQHFPNQLCQHAAIKPAVEVVVAVRSWPSNHANRQTIRKSLANPVLRSILPWRVVFYMGYSPDRKRSNFLRREVLKGDVIIAPFEALGNNAVNIFLDAARWVLNGCWPKLRHFIHTNDSTMVDVLAVDEFTRKLTEDSPFIHCAVVGMVPVDRDVNSSTYIAESQLRDTHFPPFCEGDAFVVSTKDLKRLLLASPVVPRIPLLGPYVTGYLPVPYNISHKDIGGQIKAFSEQQPTSNCSTSTERSLFVTNVTKLSQWMPLWFRNLFCCLNQNSTTKQAPQKIMERLVTKLLE